MNDDKEIKDGNGNLARGMCFGPIWGRGHGLVEVVVDSQGRRGKACPICGGLVVSEKTYWKKMEEFYWVKRPKPEK